jgi:hypothetical protein
MFYLIITFVGCHKNTSSRSHKKHEEASKKSKKPSSLSSFINHELKFHGVKTKIMAVMTENDMTENDMT